MLKNLNSKCLKVYRAAKEGCWHKAILITFVLLGVMAVGLKLKPAANSSIVHQNPEQTPVAWLVSSWYNNTQVQNLLSLYDSSALYLPQANPSTFEQLERGVEFQLKTLDQPIAPSPHIKAHLEAPNLRGLFLEIPHNSDLFAAILPWNEALGLELTLASNTLQKPAKQTCSVLVTFTSLTQPDRSFSFLALDLDPKLYTSFLWEKITFTVFVNDKGLLNAPFLEEGTRHPALNQALQQLLTAHNYWQSTLPSDFYEIALSF